MSENGFDMNRIFNSEEPLPEVVMKKKKEAYHRIYEEAGSQEHASFNRRWSYPKVAVAAMAVVLATGGTVYGAVGVLNRWDRMQEMDQEEVEQYYEDFQNSGAVTYYLSRAYTPEEQTRFQELKEQYEKNLRFPEYEIRRLTEDETYDGTGICLKVTGAGKENILYLPEGELTDEELLEIIEYQAKQDYAYYETARQQALEKGNYESRLAAMTDEEVDHYYLAFYSCKTDLSDGYCRKNQKDSWELVTLSDTENSRYQELLNQYEKENLFPEKEVTVIDEPEEYTGTGVAVCRYDANFYLPDTELTDEELLEIIDARKKAVYVNERIAEEIRLGYRSQYPTLPGENDTEITVSEKPFARTEGKGQVAEISQAKIGDIVYFGSCQPEETEGREQIAWYVLDQSETGMTLLSVDILDGKTYQTNAKNAEWEESDLRTWLNGDFYEMAFSAEERAKIVETTVDNEKGAKTKDHVYLLSYSEFLSYFGVDVEELEHMDADTTEELDRKALYCLEHLDSRIYAQASSEAKANGLWTWEETTTEELQESSGLDFSDAEDNGSWWLRSSEGGCGIHVIDARGEIDGTQYADGIYGVRPVIQIEY